MDRIPGFGPGDGGSIPSGLVNFIYKSLNMVCAYKINGAYLSYEF